MATVELSEMESYIAILSQLFVLALFVERVTTVLGQLITGKGGDDELAVSTWDVKRVVGALVLSSIVCFGYEHDAVKLVLAGKTNCSAASPCAIPTWPWLGYLLTALLLAGGSAGIRKLMEAIAAATIKSKSESLVRNSQAKSYLAEAAQIEIATLAAARRAQ